VADLSKLEAEARRRLEEALLAAIARERVGGAYLWRLAHLAPEPEVELALYRMRKAGLVTYDRNGQAWRLR
jgi:hypothetical protein